MWTMLDAAVQWLGRQGVRIEAVGWSIPLMIAGYMVIHAVDRLLTRATLHARLNLPYEFVAIAQRMVGLLLWSGLILLLMSFWGVGVGGIWTFLVSAAAVIGAGFLATWAMISNVTAGLFITIWRPFHLGAVVELIPENVGGRVVERNMMFTVLREPGGATLLVPNNLFFQKMFRVTGAYESFPYEALDGLAESRPRPDG